MKKLLNWKALAILIILVLGFFIWRDINSHRADTKAKNQKTTTAAIGDIIKIREEMRQKDLRFIWLFDEKTGKIRPVIIRIGITDNEYTEIKEVFYGELREGEFVVTGIINKKSEGQKTGNSLSLNQLTRALR
ncbi:MAG: hypothetical protein Q8N90_04475 [bacterium]|nr:hypothetical protein [bacterium]